MPAQEVESVACKLCLEEGHGTLHCALLASMLHDVDMILNT